MKPDVLQESLAQPVRKIAIVRTIVPAIQNQESVTVPVDGKVKIVHNLATKDITE